MRAFILSILTSVLIVFPANAICRTNPNTCLCNIAFCKSSNTDKEDKEDKDLPVEAIVLVGVVTVGVLMVTHEDKDKQLTPNYNIQTNEVTGENQCLIGFKYRF